MRWFTATRAKKHPTIAPTQDSTVPPISRGEFACQSTAGINIAFTSIQFDAMLQEWAMHAAAVIGNECRGYSLLSHMVIASCSDSSEVLVRDFGTLLDSISSSHDLNSSSCGRSARGIGGFRRVRDWQFHEMEVRPPTPAQENTPVRQEPWELQLRSSLSYLQLRSTHPRPPDNSVELSGCAPGPPTCNRGRHATEGIS